MPALGCAHFFRSLQRRTPTPVTLLYGRERACVAHLVLSLHRTVRSPYTPELTLEQASEFLFLMMHLPRPQIDPQSAVLTSGDAMPEESQAHL